MSPSELLTPRVDHRTSSATRQARREPRMLLDYGEERDDNRRPSHPRSSRMCETIGTYKVLEPLGRGGMGIVYRAQHTGSGRTVALKTVKIPAHKWLDCIRREVSALRTIRHPGVVGIVDHGVHDGRPWYAMDLLEGESLRQFGQKIWRPYHPSSAPISSTQELSETEDLHVRRTDDLGIDESGPQPSRRPPPGSVPPAAGYLGEVLVIMRRFCATLAYLHGEGFVNGDLKPENVLLVGNQPVIIDFGLTAHHPGGSGREALEAQWGMAGTLPYMSPEQIRGELLDARSDLYSVGCILYELLTGVQPFVGSAAAIIHQHLAMTPPPPSEFVKGMPKDLERLVLNLLEKDLTRRLGYADEVADQLAELASDKQPLSGFPTPRPYIYRPRLIGREEVLARLTGLREQARQGSGSIVLLGGESGVGKTRLAMELTRTAPAARMRVVTSESSALATESAAAVGPAPLHALRSLLQAVADRCHEGGARVTERLLGQGRSVLAMYEPALALVPAEQALEPVVPLDPHASRQRLFRCLGKTLSSFCNEQPLLWVLDDLGWADELSLAFLRSLTRDYLQAHHLLILCAYRTEEPSPEISAIVAQPHVHHITLSRLGKEAVHWIIGDMLALTDSLTGFAEDVVQQAEGNPFFVAEYLRAAVAEHVLRREERHAWYLAERGEQPPSEHSPLQLPPSLLSLIDRRLRRLSPTARQTALAAAVLGRDTDLDVLFEVARMSEEGLSMAVDELLRHQVLEQPAPERVRFAHDKLREVMLSQAASEELSDLHRGAANVLERRWKDRPNAESVWATLGHHLAAAQEHERAVHFLHLAANHARNTYANGDAIRLYQEAIRQAEHGLELDKDLQERKRVLLSLHEALGDVWLLTADGARARAAYAEGMAHVSLDDATTRARLLRKTGKTWELQHGYADAARAFDSAERTLRAHADPVPRDTRDELIHVLVDHLWICYWLNDVPQMEAIGRRLRPALDTEASPLQTSRYFDALQKRNLRRDRYVVTEETLSFSRAALSAAEQSGDFAQLLNSRFNLGFILVFSGFLDGAIAELKSSLEMAERAGDLATTTRCHAYLSLATRLQNLPGQAKDHAAKCVEAATASQMSEYLGAGLATQAWVALQERDIAGAERLARRAVDLWAKLACVYPFQWLALIPLLQIHLSRLDLEQSIVFTRQMLAPGQQYLAGAAWDALSRANAHWQASDHPGTRDALESALASLGVQPFQTSERSGP